MGALTPGQIGLSIGQMMNTLSTVAQKLKLDSQLAKDHNVPCTYKIYCGIILSVRPYWDVVVRFSNDP